MKKIDMRSYVRTWQQDGVTLSAAIAPCCWMYNSDFKVIVKIGEWNGSFIGTEDIYDRTKSFAEATPEKVEEITRHIALVPCKNPGCQRVAFDPVAFQHDPERGGRMGECEECWQKKWKAKFEQIQHEEQEKEAQEDAKQKEAGAKWKIVAVIHPARGDDRVVVWYTRAVQKPTDKAVKGLIKKMRSEVLDDFTVSAL